jgi:hypothetical protein
MNSREFNELEIWHEGCTQDIDAILGRKAFAELLL